MKINILTLFPEMFDIFNHSILKRAMDNNLLSINAINIRDYSTNKHKKVDDYPYGGGFGMVLTCQPVVDAIRKIKETDKGPIIYLGPRGRKFDQKVAKELSSLDNFTLLCGHYEGIDERIYDYIDDEISLGDFILTGGEMAAVPIIDSVARLREGVLGSDESSSEESFSDDTLEYPQYTRPAEFEGKKVPEVLLTGHHENIRKWRRFMSLEITRKKRQDLFKKITLSNEDFKIIKKFQEDSNLK